jgi:acetyltransferase-like isoleucine patch superfamily enzyme
MNALSMIEIKRWVKESDGAVAACARGAYFKLRFAELPLPKVVAQGLYGSYDLVRNTLASIVRVIWWTPLFKSQLASDKGELYLYGGMPYCAGPVDIHMGRRVRLSGQTTITGRGASRRVPQLVIGDNVGIGWMTTFAVGQRIELGDNVRIAGRSALLGYPGHPLDATARAAGLPDTDEQVGDIVLERDVWLGTGVLVNAGVRIGQGTIIAAGSVVTKDLPPFVLAGGAPARVIRALAEGGDHHDLT